MRKPSLAIVIQKQFGYHSDTYYYCKYLREKYDITYICWDYKDPRMGLENVRVIYISRQGNLPKRNIRFIATAVYHLRKMNFDKVLIKYFRGCSALRLLFPRQKFLVDIRSGAMEGSGLGIKAYDVGMVSEVRLFKHISIISPSLADKLGLSTRAAILPLGADVISSQPRRFDRFNLLFVGTLNQRFLDRTLYGVAEFLEKHPVFEEIFRYTIVGGGIWHGGGGFKGADKGTGVAGPCACDGKGAPQSTKNLF